MPKSTFLILRKAEKKKRVYFFFGEDVKGTTSCLQNLPSEMNYSEVEIRRPNIKIVPFKNGTTKYYTLHLTSLVL